MAIEKLSPEQIQTVINDAYEQMTGQQNISTIEGVEKVVDVGVKELKDYRDTWTGALLVRLAKLWYTDESYESSTAALYYEDAMDFGAICEYINIDIPDAQANSAWMVGDGSQVGVYTLRVPRTTVRFFTRSDCYEIPLDFTGTQLDQAFTSNDELKKFVAACWIKLNNKLQEHIEDMCSLNRNVFVANKLIQMHSEGNTKMHVYNLVRGYVDYMGIQTTYTVKQALQDADFFRWASKKIGSLVGFLKKQTNLFNEGDSVKFVPKSRLVVEMLEEFVNMADAFAYSTTFNKNLVELPLYQTTPAWQAITDMEIGGLGRIKVELNDVEVDTKTYGGETNTIVIGLATDKWALAHTTITHKIASQHFNIEDVDVNRAQQHDKYMQNLELPAIVFTMSDVIVE